MPQSTCVVVFADGTPCPRFRKYADGTCAACYTWALRNPGKPLSSRLPAARVQSSTCLVTFGNGKACARPARYAPGWCVNCWKWSREHARDPQGRPYLRSPGELRAALDAAARATGEECVILDGLAYRWTTNLVGGGQINAARAVWILAEGDPGDLSVLHTCHRGEEGCISRAHLYLGDQARNMADMVAAGRASNGSRGEGFPLHKLTRGQVAEIRARYVKGARYPDPGSARAVAEAFGIHRDYVPELARGKRWAWLGEESAHGQSSTATAQVTHVVATT